MVQQFVGRNAKNKNPVWRLLCSCGEVFFTQGSYVPKSCGCLRSHLGREAAKKGSSYRNGNTARYRRTYQSWYCMKCRCDDPERKHYGAAGVTYPARWSHFDTFLRDMGPRPTGCTLDRIDSSKDYSPDNCRWASQATQSANKRNMKTIKGVSLSKSKWAEIADAEITASEIRARLTARQKIT